MTPDLVQKIEESIRRLEIAKGCIHLSAQVLAELANLPDECLTLGVAIGSVMKVSDKLSSLLPAVEAPAKCKAHEKPRKKGGRR